MDLNIILTIIGIISPFILAAVWMTTLITRTSNRALLLEVKIKDQEDRVIKLEVATSYSSIEKIVEKVCFQVLHSREFKDSMKESLEGTIEKSVKNTLIHIEKNRSSGQVGAFEEILNEIRHIHDEIIRNNNI
jgi:predicted AAA+ superfamily ATPase